MYVVPFTIMTITVTFITMTMTVITVIIIITVLYDDDSVFLMQAQFFRLYFIFNYTSHFKFHGPILKRLRCTMELKREGKNPIKNILIRTNILNYRYS